MLPAECFDDGSMTDAVLPLGLLLDGFNRLVAGNDWLRTALQARQGQGLRIEALGVVLGLRIAADGGLIEARELVTDAALADTRIRLRAERLDRLFLEDSERRLEAFDVSGDPALAQMLARLLPALQREWSARLPVPVMAMLKAQPFTGLASAAAGNLAEYLTHESHLLAAPAKVNDWQQEVRRLRDDVARLEARVARLGGGRG